jgi:hypothetical protein
MKNEIPGDPLTYIVGSDNPLLPDLILNLSKGENNTITGNVHVLIKNYSGNKDVLQLPLKGTWSIKTEHEVFIELSGFAEKAKEPVASIWLTLDDQWNGGTGNYQFGLPYLYTGSNETVHKMSHATHKINPDNQ